MSSGGSVDGGAPSAPRAVEAIVLVGLLIALGGLAAYSFQPGVFGPDMGQVLGPGVALRFLIVAAAALVAVDLILVLRLRGRPARNRCGVWSGTPVVVLAWSFSCIACLYLIRDISLVLALAVFTGAWTLWFGERKPLAVLAGTLTSVALGWLLTSVTGAPVERLAF